MKKKVLCTALAVTMLLTTTASATAKPWWLSKYRVTFDNELGIVGNVTLQFASDGGSFIRSITKRYGESISLESYVPTKYGYTFKGWFTDPRTKQNQVTTFKFTKPDVLYAKWEKNPEEPINPNDEIITKDTCYLTDEELEKFKAEAFRTHSTGNRVYQQAGAYILMLNTGLRIGELLGLLNSDIDLENKTMTIRQAVKLVDQRDGTKLIGGKVKKVGKTKTTTSKRVVPLNSTAIEMIHDLRKEFYFGEDTPLVCDANGDYANPTNLRKRLYRIEDAAGIETKGLHAFRHTFATKLINGTKCADGSIKNTKHKSGSRHPRTHHYRDNRKVLCKEGHLKANRNHRRIRDMTESQKIIPLRMKLNHSQGYQNLIRINKEKENVAVIVLIPHISLRL